MRRLSWRVVVAIAMAAVIGGASGVLASHNFSDVPSNHPFHDEISAVADAGIARGFSGGTYRPGDPVTRQAMAAFLERGLGRVGYASNSGSIGNADGYSMEDMIASVGVDAGSAGAGTNGFALVSASVEAATTDTGYCPCRIVFEINVDGIPSESTVIQLEGAPDDSAKASEAGSLQSVFLMEGDQSASFAVTARLDDSDVPSISIDANISVLWVPFGPDGDNSLVYEFTCTQFESEPNDVRVQANPSGPGCIRAEIHPDTDVDNFSIGVSAGQSLRAETKSLDGAGCNGDTFVELFTPDGTFLQQDDDGGIGVCSQLVTGPLTAGSYLVRVESFANQSSFSYRLELTVGTGSSAEEPARDPGDKD